jgi:hypothetical protein
MIWLSVLHVLSMLTIYSLVITTCPTGFNNQYLLILYLLVSYDLSVKNYYFLKQHELDDLYNVEVLCFLCSTDWILKYYLMVSCQLQRFTTTDDVIMNNAWMVIMASF